MNSKKNKTYILYLHSGVTYRRNSHLHRVRKEFKRLPDLLKYVNAKLKNRLSKSRPWEYWQVIYDCDTLIFAPFNNFD